MTIFRTCRPAVLTTPLTALLLAFAPASSSLAQPAPAQSAMTYADLVDLADSAPMVLRASLRSLTRIEPERARGVRPGWGRFYAVARTESLLSGASAVGEALHYLVDLPLDAKGKPPKLKKASVLLFARADTGRPGELQLVAPDAQVLATADTEARVRTILGELISPDRPARITGVREVIHVPGTLAGEGETQIFLSSPEGAASVAVRHRPDEPTRWGISFSEIMANVSDPPPAPDTLAWYRLACFLPNALPANANLSETADARSQAQADYRFVLGALGPCPRNRGG